MPSSSLTSKITPKRQKQALGLFSLVTIYSLLGFFAAPLVVKTLMQNYVADKLKLELSLTQIEINPLQLAVRLDGLQIREPQGQTLVSAKSIYLNAGFWSSLWQRRFDIDELDLQRPFINAHINKAGQLNLLQLIPPQDKSPSSAWQLSVLGVHEAQIDMLDESRVIPFVSQLKSLSLTLYNLSSQAADKGNYQFTAQTDKGERLRWQGTVALQPMRSQGHLVIEHLQATTPASYMAEQLPITVKQGEIGISADYQLSLADNKPSFSLTHGHAVISDIKAEAKAKNSLFYDVAKIELEDLSLQSLDPQAQFKRFSLDKVQLTDRQGQTPFIELQQLMLQDGAWQQQTDNASLKQLDLAQLIVRDQQKNLLSLPKVIVEHLSVKPQKQFIDTGRIIITGGDTSLEILANNQTNWQRALPSLLAHFNASKAADVVTEDKPWTYALGELQLARFSVAAEDQRQKPAIKEPISINSLTINPELDLSRPHVLAADIGLGTGGKIKLQGQLQESPLLVDTQITLTHLALPPLAPYLNNVARLHLESGDVDVDGHLHLQQQPKLQITYDGNLGINQFAANDIKLNERFLAWNRLLARGVKWQLEPMKLDIKQVLADQPFTRVIIAPDKTINLEQVITNASSSSAATDNNTEKMPLHIDKVNVTNGSMLFADLTIKPQFATGIQSLNGEISGISSSMQSVAKIALTGRVDQYGKAIISGALNPFSPDKNSNVLVKFQNIELTTLTPYSAKFAGYRIDQGKLSLDLDYKIQNRQLVSTNKITLNQLTLGEKVDSPDAVSLPLRLAIALLKDSNGVIDLDIPLTGSLDDPKFRVGPIIWQAFVNVITKVATAPFRFIASLVGGGDDMDSIAFAAGGVVLDIDNDNDVKLAKIAEALTKRPNLRIELRGGFDKEADSQAMKLAKFNQLLKARLAQNNNEQKVLELLFTERFGQEALKQQRAISLKPKEDAANKDALLVSQNSFSQSLRNELIKSQDVQEGDLRQLALDRARIMRMQLVEKNKIEEGRVFILEPEASKMTDKQLVISKVTVNGG